MGEPEEILSFWLDEVGPKGWYKNDETLDRTVRERFADTWQRGREGAHSLWLTYPGGVLGYLILMDQFPRNMFRGEAAAFATDRAAMAAAKAAIGRRWDLTIDEPARQFFYLPLMHSENLCDQDRCVRLLATRLTETGEDNLLHAKAHREVIRRFGRFPHRNAALGRDTTAAEAAFLSEGGYGATVDALKAAA